MRSVLDIPAPLDGQLWRYRLPGPPLSRHHHPELELDLVIGGEARLAVDETVIDLGPRSLVFVHPGRSHVVLDHSDDFEMWIACFRRRLVRRACTGEAARPLRARRGAAVPCRTLGVSAARRLNALLAEVSAYGDAATYNAGLGHVLLHAWLAYRQAD